MWRALYAMMRVPDFEVRLTTTTTTTTTAIATTTGLIITIIIMYLVMCYFSRLEHTAHYKAKNTESTVKPFQRRRWENF